MKKILYFISLIILLIFVNFSIAQMNSAAKIPTRVSFAFISQKLNKNNCDTTFKANLIRTDTIKNLSGKPIKFFQDTILKGTVNTNSKGDSSLTITTLPGPHSAYVSFSGDSAYLASGDSNVVEYTCNLPIPPIIFKLVNGSVVQGVKYSYKMPTPTGGSGPPYHFQLDSFASGSPPMGIILSPDGTLSGTTKSPPGKYCFTVIAVDTAGNQGKAGMCITVIQGLPNLTPFKPINWFDKIVVTNYLFNRDSLKSNLEMKNGILDQIDNLLVLEGIAINLSDNDFIYSTNTYTFTTNDYLYVSKAVINDGFAATTKDFYTYLYVDNSLKYKFKLSGKLDPDYYAYNLNAPLGKLKAGTHTIKIFADATTVIKEGNESDNKYAINLNIISVGSGQCTGFYSAPNACGPCSSDAQCSPNYCWTNNPPAPFC